MHMQVYSGLSPKKTFKKPNLGEPQIKAVFQATLLLLRFKISCARPGERRRCPACQIFFFTVLPDAKISLWPFLAKIS
jgi:hypothetical protein